MYEQNSECDNSTKQQITWLGFEDSDSVDGDDVSFDGGLFGKVLSSEKRGVTFVGWVFLDMFNVYSILACIDSQGFIRYYKELEEELFYQTSLYFICVDVNIGQLEAEK